MAESGVRVTPPISGCATRQPQSRIPKLTPRTSKDEQKKASPRTSKLPTPKTVSSSGLRKITSELASTKNVPAKSPNSTKPSVSESTIAKKSVRSLVKPPSSPRGLKLAVPSQTPIPRLNGKSNGCQNQPQEKGKSTNERDKKSLEDISDDIFERVYKSGENITPLEEEVAPPGFLDSDSAESLPESNHTVDLPEKKISGLCVVVKKPGIGGSGEILPVVPPLDLNLLDDYETARAYEALEEEQFVTEEKLLEELESQTEDDKRLAEEKQHLLDDMQSLKEKLERQQSQGSTESVSDKEQLEEKLKVKQEEVDSVNKKFAELLDEQQQLLTKVSEQKTSRGGFGNAFLVAVFAVLIGVGYILWQSR